MRLKDTGETALEEIDRYDDGVGWLAYPDEPMQRASHALVREDEVWLIDPLDADGLADLIEPLGEVAGVVVLLERHTRDAAALARRYGVAVHAPRWMGIGDEIDAPYAAIHGSIAGFEVRRVVDRPGWREAALVDDTTLVVADALGTASYFRAPGERIGVHPMLRLRPPSTLAWLDPDRILCGHGAGIAAGVGTELHAAIQRARRTAPRLYWETLKEFIGK